MPRKNKDVNIKQVTLHHSQRTHLDSVKYTMDGCIQIKLVYQKNAFGYALTLFGIHPGRRYG